MIGAASRLCAALPLMAIVVLSSCGQTAEQTGGGKAFDALADYTDWQPQDYADSQAIKAVELDGGGLKLDCRFRGGDSNLSKGEAFLDLRYVPGIEDQTPIDMSRSKIVATVRVPGEFAGDRDAPNGVQVFVKDTEFRCQYGTWVNITYGGHYKAVLEPRAGDIEWGYTAPGFDPAKVIIVGVKFGIGSASRDTYEGVLYVEKVKLEPDLGLTPFALTIAPAPGTTPALAGGIEARPDGFYVEGRKTFILGGNWRILEYGQDFGTTKWFPGGNGITRHLNYVRGNLDRFRGAGIRALRVFLLCDGAAVFDKDGHVAGYNDRFRQDVRAFLDSAHERGVMVEFVLFDYLVAGKGKLVSDVWVRGRSAIITDEGLTKEFLSAFLVPFLDEFGKHPALFGFDLINEPEWVVKKEDGGGWETAKEDEAKAQTPVAGEKLQAFLTTCADAIHKRAPGRLVTMGVSCPFAGLAKKLPLDYFAIHHYPWMDGPEHPDALKECVAALPPGKPWVLEEFPTFNSPVSITGYLDRALALGAAGAMPWNLRPECDDASMRWEEREAKFLEMKPWVEEFSVVIGGK